MKTITRYWNQDRDGSISLLILFAIVLLYVSAMVIWLLYEWNKPVTQYRIYDIGGHALAARLTVKVWNKLFKRDRG